MKTTRTSPSKPSSPGSHLGFRRQPKGAALVLALLVLTALMGVSLVATESTVFENRYVGAYRLLSMGHYVAEGGHALTLGQVTLTPGAVVATNYAIDDAFFGGTFAAAADGDGISDDPGSWGMEYRAAAVGARRRGLPFYVPFKQEPLQDWATLFPGSPQGANWRAFDAPNASFAPWLKASVPWESEWNLSAPPLSATAVQEHGAQCHRMCDSQAAAAQVSAALAVFFLVLSASAPRASRA